jgi:cytochrome b
VNTSSTVKVWDPLVRIFHWSLVLCFGGAYLLGEDGGALHQAPGYGVLGLVAFRLVWGFIGPRTARFASFVPTPGRLSAYAKQVLTHREPRYLGHNPAGGAMIVLLLAALAGTGLTGWMMTTDALWGAEWVEEVHEALAGGTLALVGLHLAGVVFSSIRHRENLVAAMFSGRKRAS